MGKAQKVGPIDHDPGPIPASRYSARQLAGRQSLLRAGNPSRDGQSLSGFTELLPNEVEFFIARLRTGGCYLVNDLVGVGGDGAAAARQARGARDAALGGRPLPARRAHVARRGGRRAVPRFGLRMPAEMQPHEFVLPAGLALVKFT